MIPQDTTPRQPLRLHQFNLSSHFLSTQVFGPYRLDLLHADLQAADTAQRRDRTERAQALRRAITEAEAKRKRLVRNLEYVEEPDEELIRDMNTRRAELRTKQDDLQPPLARYVRETATGPPHPTRAFDRLAHTAFEHQEIP